MMWGTMFRRQRPRFSPSAHGMKRLPCGSYMDRGFKIFRPRDIEGNVQRQWRIVDGNGEIAFHAATLASAHSLLNIHINDRKGQQHDK